MVHNISESNSVANQFIAQLRDSNIQQNRQLFRRNLQRLGQIFAYEISKTFKYKVQNIETPLGIASAFLPENKIVLATILRAGLPLHQGLLDYFDNADNAFVSTFRKHHKDGTFEVSMEYINCPDVKGATLILSDAMLATGSSMQKSLEAILSIGKPKEVHIVTIIATQFGLNHIRRLFPKVRIWVGAIDEELTAKSYIVPGLGDAGDLAFGGKFSD